MSSEKITEERNEKITEPDTEERHEYDDLDDDTATGIAIAAMHSRGLKKLSDNKYQTRTETSTDCTIVCQMYRGNLHKPHSAKEVLVECISCHRRMYTSPGYSNFLTVSVDACDSKAHDAELLTNEALTQNRAIVVCRKCNQYFHIYRQNFDKEMHRMHLDFV